MKVMLLMRSDGSYAGGGAEEDYRVWADYEASLKADGVFSDSGRFADGGGSSLVATTLASGDRDGDASAEPRNSGDPALVGYYLIDCGNFEQAVEYARRAPLYGSVEVRPLADY